MVLIGFRNDIHPIKLYYLFSKFVRKVVKQEQEVDTRYISSESETRGS